MQKYNLEHYDGVLAFGDTLSKVYKQEGWHGRVYTWHEAADTDTYYHPVEGVEQEGDVVWIGNWGDDERTQELHEYILEPVKALGLRVKFYGVRYPGHAMKALAAAGIIYGDWLPSYKVAETFARYKATIHVPRRFYNEYLPGIPTIRPFEAMACKIPLLCAPWQDVEQLFEEGKDYLMARSGQEMTDLLHQVISKPQLSRAMCEHAYHTILDRHTCRHRAEQLMGIMKDIIQSKAIKTSV
jgi:spore maturation protein CgeB